MGYSSRMRKNTLLTAFLLLIGVSVVFFIFVNFGSITTDNRQSEKHIPDSILFTSSPVLTPEEALHTFEIEEGFRIELVASEPLIHDPVAMDFDEKGRIWVAEMQSYMPGIEGKGEDWQIGRIVILEDQDGDGKMDHSKVFLDGLVLPRTISIARGGLFYSEPPHLWFVENLNDKPGKKILVDSAYAVGGNVEHQPNGMMRGIDNWFYNAKSSARYKYQDGQWIQEDTEFRGQWGITKDNYGRLFYNTNSNQLRGDLVPPSMMIRNPNFRSNESVNREIADDQRVYPIRPTPGVNRGYKEEVLDEAQKLIHFTAAGGPVIYRGDQFPDEYQGNAFVCEPSANLIKRNIIIEKGPYVTAEQAYTGQEFLASRDERFRPVSLYNGPDGGLYVVDMYRGIIQHKTYLTDYLKDQIRSRNLDDPIGFGRIYRIVYEGNWFEQLTNKWGGNPKPALDEATDEELVSYLSHPNGWWRDNAQRLLVERNNPAVVPALTDLLTGDNPLAKIHALWTLEGIGFTSPDIIRLGILAENPKVVATALRVAERNADTKHAEETLGLYEEVSSNKDAQVQLQLALSLGEFIETDSAQVIKMLKTIAVEQGDDALIREAVVSSVTGKERQFLTMLSEEAPGQLAMIKLLNEVIASAELKNQLKGIELTKEEKEQFILGKSLYEQTCAGCHQENGEGLTPIAPPLAGSEWVVGPEERLILIALHGLKGPVTVKGKVYKEPEVQPVMPGLKDNPEFTNEQLAAVLTYVRKAWGNAADAIDPAKVKEIRESTVERDEPFTEQDFIQ